MNTTDRIAALIVETAARFGDFTLRSGLKSHFYLDKYQLFAQPGILHQITREIADLIPADTGVLAGLELGGVPLATSLGLYTCMPMAFVRKEAKAYGTCLIAEGANVKGETVTVVEDVVTTGGQVLESVAKLRELGAHVDIVVCVLFRGTADVMDRFKEQGLSLRALYTYEQLEHLIEAKKVANGV